MRWLDDERGVSLVFVAILLLVLFGFAAFAVDASALYEERRELQNGADAAVLAIAEDCAFGLATGLIPCDVPYATGTADAYADANAQDAAAGIEDLILDTSAATVTVVTNTEEAGTASTLFAPFFAQVFGYGGTTVHGQATAAWGYPAGLSTIPLIISVCEYDKFADPLVVGPPPVGWTPAPTVILFHDGNTTEECAAEAEQDADEDGKLDGGFGWLETSEGCGVEIENDGWVSSDPGASASTGCDPATLKELILEKVVFIPYFDDLVSCTGAELYCATMPPPSGPLPNGKWYHVQDFGAFYVTGYNFAGQYKETINPSGVLPCFGDKRCIEGYFTTGSASAGDIGGEFKGVVIVKLTG